MGQIPAAAAAECSSIRLHGVVALSKKVSKLGQSRGQVGEGLLRLRHHLFSSPS